MQFKGKDAFHFLVYRHNPCFTGNSFAISVRKDVKQIRTSHNPCFTGNSFAIEIFTRIKKVLKSHNPCFTGNSFAIEYSLWRTTIAVWSQSLFYWKLLCNNRSNQKRTDRTIVTILVLLETPLQY